MKRIVRKTAVIWMAFAMILTMMPALGTVTDGPLGAQTAYAATKPYLDKTVGGFIFDLYDDINDGSGTGAGSVKVKGYSGSSKEIAFPAKVTYEGVTFTTKTSDFVISENALKNKTSITKVAIPSGYFGIGEGAFEGCTSLTEVSIGTLGDYGSYGGIGANAFKGCTNLKTYNIDSSGLSDGDVDLIKEQLINAGIGKDSSGHDIAGVTVWTQDGSAVYKAIEKINLGRDADKKIDLGKSGDPYSRNTISGSSSSSETKGEDGTPYGKGASESVVNKAITKLSSETDPKGSAFGLLKANLNKVTNTSVALKWSKVSGAKRYVVYGNTCNAGGKKYKLVKLKSTTKTKISFTKVNKKKVKKGTYYKFMVVALDKNNKVVSTSKIIHAATAGGKVGNDKAVKTKAKKDKVSLKKGKTFKLKATPVPKSKKLKVKKHRGISYESSNKKIATVDKKGVIKAKAKGSCSVYAYAQDGVFKKIKVTVK